MASGLSIIHEGGVVFTAQQHNTQHWFCNSLLTHVPDTPTRVEHMRNAAAQWDIYQQWVASKLEALQEQSVPLRVSLCLV